MAAKKPSSDRNLKHRLKMAYSLVFRHISTKSTRSRKLATITVGVGCASVLVWYVVQQTQGNRKSVFSLKPMESETGIFKSPARCEAKNENIASSSDETSKTCQNNCRQNNLGNNQLLSSAIEKARNIVRQKKEECGTPGFAVGVSVDGRVVWQEGFGYSDVENVVKCTPETVFRIASISKPLTATLAAKLWEQKKLDVDASVQKYVPSFPEKSYDGKKVMLTTRHLLSHLGGIRNYKREANLKEKEENQQNKKGSREPEEKSEDTKNLGSDKNDSKTEKSNDFKNSKELKKEKKKEKEEYFLQEFLIKDHFKSVTEALALFKDDPLMSEPGTKYLYTTYGWTLISAVIEGATQEDFLTSMRKLFREIGMENTIEEQNQRIIHNRGRHYLRNKSGHLMNTPYVDNSYKWAGGGFLSTVGDLLKFGNAMLYASQVGCVQAQNESLLPGILSSSTVSEMWKVVPRTEELSKANGDVGYGLGWFVQPEVYRYGSCKHTKQIISHTGGAVGASSVLAIEPHDQKLNLKNNASVQQNQNEVKKGLSCYSTTPPKGIVVAILVNMQGVRLKQTACTLIECFEGLEACP